MSSTVLPAAELLEGAVGRRGLDAADAGNRQTTKLGPAHSHEAIGALSRVTSAVVGGYPALLLGYRQLAFKAPVGPVF
jgi:hypothetical protein